MSVSDPQIRDARVTAADTAAIRDGAQFAIELIAAACARYAHRPVFGARASTKEAFVTITYSQLWERVVALATGLNGVIERGQLVGLLGSCTIDWIVADLACLYVGAVSVPLQTNLSDEDLAQAIAQTELRCVFVGDGRHIEVERVIDIAEQRRIESMARTDTAMAPLRPSGDDTLFSIVFTSGSTGGLKGVMLPEKRWATTLRDAVQSIPMPTVTVAYLPMSHMAGRIALYTTLMGGGTSYLVTNGDMSTLFDDIRDVRPTSLTLVPRVSGMIHQHYQSQLVQRGKSASAEIMTEMRETLLGGRLCFVTTGAAPTAPEIVAFLEQCLEVYIVDTYGSTEFGRVTVNGKVQPWISYKLVDVPELGYTRADKPYPRGELAVKSERETPGYYKNEAATASLRDAEGYLLSGDIVEERAPGQIAWLDRKNSVLRLSHGEFVNLSRLEDLYVANSPYIDQMFVHGNSHRAYVLAVIVPSIGATKQQLRHEIERIARETTLPSHEVPRDFVVETEPFSAANGLLTETKKPRRPKLAERYRPQLDALYAEIEARQLRTLDGGGSVEEKIRGAFAVTLGLETSEISDDATFARLGGDSFSALRLAALIEEHCGVAVPVGSLLDANATIGRLVARVEGPRTSGVTFSDTHGASGWAHAKELTVATFLPADLIAAAASLPAAGDANVVLLTGANGFLGHFLLLELLARSREVICIVRALDDAAARSRLRGAFHGELALRFDALASRLTVYRGDLLEPRLGLSETTYAELAARVDAVLHNGALVNHAYTYEHLFQPNVVGTAEVARFAITTRKKAIHFVSTTGVTVGMRGRVDETATAPTLWSRRPVKSGGTDYALGYTTSKWAAETLLGDLVATCGVPVTVSRCSMVLPHSTLAEVNEGDGFARIVYGLARTHLAPASFYADDYTGVRHYDGLPVDVVAEFVAALATSSAHGLAVYHVSNPQREVSLDTIVGWIEAAGTRFERLPYAAWFEQFRAALDALPDEEQRRTPLAIIHRWAHPMGGRDAALELDTAQFDARWRELVGTRITGRIDRAYVEHCARAIVGGEP
ncbi:MAG TPA: thioester reductase domain-containing protein [Kofleriaceae bacterium]